MSFISVPILSFGILFLQGLQISDLINSLTIVKDMAKSKTLTYFYQNSGIYFHPKALLTDLILFLKFAVPFGGILLGTWKDKKINPWVCWYTPVIPAHHTSKGNGELFVFEKESFYIALAVLELFM